MSTHVKKTQEEVTRSYYCELTCSIEKVLDWMQNEFFDKIPKPLLSETLKWDHGKKGTCWELLYTVNIRLS